MCYLFFLFRHNTVYEIRISDWISDLCSSALAEIVDEDGLTLPRRVSIAFPLDALEKLIVGYALPSMIESRTSDGLVEVLVIGVDRWAGLVGPGMIICQRAAKE